MQRKRAFEGPVSYLQLHHINLGHFPALYFVQCHANTGPSTQHQHGYTRSTSTIHWQFSIIDNFEGSEPFDSRLKSSFPEVDVPSCANYALSGARSIRDEGVSIRDQASWCSRAYSTITRMDCLERKYSFYHKILVSFSSNIEQWTRTNVDITVHRHLREQISPVPTRWS